MNECKHIVIMYDSNGRCTEMDCARKNEGYDLPCFDCDTGDVLCSGYEEKSMERISEVNKMSEEIAGLKSCACSDQDCLPNQAYLTDVYGHSVLVLLCPTCGGQIVVES